MTNKSDLVVGQLYRLSNFLSNSLDPDEYNLVYTHGGGKQCWLKADELLVFMGQRVVEEDYELFDEYAFLSPEHGHVVVITRHKKPLSFTLVVDEEKNS